jgi:hypothetical protein
MGARLHLGPIPREEFLRYGLGSSTMLKALASWLRLAQAAPAR